MPTTAAGTVYTITAFTSSAGEACQRAVANAHAADVHIPLVLFCHGNPGTVLDSADFQFGAGYTLQREWVIDNGWAYVEGHGAGANWGNTAARTAYRAMYSDTAAVWSIGNVVVIGRSMGNIVANYLATRDTLIAPRCVGFVSLSGTCDLTNRYASAGATDRAALLAAYGVATQAQLTVAVADFDPLLYNGALWDGRKAITQYDTGDTTVPPTPNGIQWLAQYSSRLAVSQSKVTTGGDHNSTPNNPAQAAATVAFLELVNIPYVPPASFVGTKVLGMKVQVGGVWTSVTPHLP